MSDEQQQRQPEQGQEETRLKLEPKPERKGRWWKRILVSLLVLVLLAVGGAAGTVYWAVDTYGDGLPAVPRPDEYLPPILSEVYTDDQVLAAEFYNERRKVVPYERIPKRLVQAFIASEDSSFFDHFGVDVLGTSRAAWYTLRKKMAGSSQTQGGSTLTQQTAKAILISREGYKSATEKSLKRKIREAILAWRLEQALTKEEILYLYLNNVYLGHHSHGVQSAAENYFRKDVKDLSLAEMALVAGLPQAPSRYSPFVRPEAAKKRRSYVLRRMLEEGMVTRAEYDEAMRTEVRVFPVEDVFHGFAPYFVEEVRKNLVDRFGNPTLLDQGLKVFTTMDSERQRAAQDAVMAGLLQLDKRQGFRGPVMQLAGETERKAFLARAEKGLDGEPLQPGRVYAALVTQVESAGAKVQVGKTQAYLPLLGMRWARKVNAEAFYPAALISDARKAVAPGDVVLVRAVAEPRQLADDREAYDARLEKELPKGLPLVRLEQEPEPQSALVSVDPHRQYLVAMVGGYDFDANEFNRAYQACRQPGSSFKPLVYAAALEGFGELKGENRTEATVIVDSPIVFDDPSNQVRWKPGNFSDDFAGDVLLRHALINSMNIPAVKTFNEVGVAGMAEWSKRLGLSTPMNPDLSAALGSSCVIPAELTGVYATFARMGIKRPTWFIRKIEDRFGRRVEDHTAYDDPWASLQDRVGGGYARLFQPGERVYSPETGFILVDLLRGVVTSGTGAPALKLGKPAAGKTGTTNDAFDTWFAAFTRDLVTVTWVGYDMNPHPLGKYETGGRAALPIWLAYMQRALEGRPQPEFSPPPGADLVTRRIDTKTGKLASDGSKGVTTMWFKQGTEPEEQQAEKGTVDSNQFMME